MGRGAGGVNGMDLDRKITWSAWTPCNPRLISSAKEHNQTSTNLEELENEAHQRFADHFNAHRRRKGFGKRTPLSEYRITSRGGKGVVQHEAHRSHGSVVATLQSTKSPT